MTKRFLTISLSFMLGVAVITSCVQPTTPSNTNNNNNNTTPHMSAKINGKLWTADNITTSESFATTGLKAVIGTYSVDNSQLTVYLPQSASKKKFSFDGKTVIVSFQTDTASFAPYPSNPGSGNITVDQYSGGIISGSFTGYVPSATSAASLISITEGSFAGNLQ